ncbi:MAG: xylann 1,4-beta-xylosidase [Faecalibacterium sp.]
MKQTNIVADFSTAGVHLPHFWSKCVGAGRAGEGLRADWQKQLKKSVEECGFSYLRFHGLLTDDMGIVHRRADGSIGYQFAYVDNLFDAMLEIGIRPFVEFGFMPKVMASGEASQFWWNANITPPAKMEEWYDLIYTLIAHWQERYGKEETQQWYYEIWNEADLSGFWTGTKSDYFALYKTAVTAIKSVDPALKVGGPATSNFVPDARFDGEREDVSKHITHTVEDLDSLNWRAVWVEDFLAFCAKEGLPVDFVSTHPYPTDFALDGQSKMKGRSRKKGAVKDDLIWLKNVIANSAYPHAETHLTEWSSSPSSRDCAHDFLPAANYIVKSNLDCTGLTDSLSYWVFTDIFEEAGPGPIAFHGGFGMQTLHGIAKPSHHAYRMLNALGEVEICRGEEYLVSKTSDGGAAILMYNYAEEEPLTVPMSVYPDTSVAVATQSQGADSEITLALSGLAPNAVLTLEIMDETHGTAVTEWLAMGAPDNLTRAQEKTLKEIADTLRTQEFTADANGALQANITLPRWGVALLKTI